MSFTPSFEVSWDTPDVAVAPKPAPAPRPKLDAFGIDEAFANYHANFSTEIEQQKLVQPNPVTPIEDISKTEATKIFEDFCQNKFGFKPVFDK